MFLMLNPSTADEMKSDPTVTRCKGFARTWGYGSLWVCNLFALRSSDPSDAQGLAPDPTGPQNDRNILRGTRRTRGQDSLRVGEPWDCTATGESGY